MEMQELYFHVYAWSSQHECLRVHCKIFKDKLSERPQVNVAPLHPYYNYSCAVSAFTVKAGPYTEIITAVTLEAGKRMCLPSESLQV